MSRRLSITSGIAVLNAALAPVLALALAALGDAPPVGAQDWTTIPLGTTANLLELEKFSWNQRYVVGEGGTAFQSDGTRTVWTPVAHGMTSDLTNILQPASGQVWLGATAGDVRVKVAGVWEPRSLSGTVDARLFTNVSGAAYAVGGDGSIHRSTNLGTNWIPQVSGTSLPLYDGQQSSATAWIVGAQGTVLKTTNFGASWASIPSGTSADLLSLWQFGATTLVAVGEGGTIIKSTDGGATWAPRVSPTSLDLRDISSSATTANWLFVAGDGGTCLRSTNQGESWCKLNTGTTSRLNSVIAFNGTEYIVCGDGGLLMRTTNGGGGCVAGTDAPVIGGTMGGGNGIGATHFVRAPYPNPIRERLTFDYRVEQAQRVVGDLIDAAGRRVVPLVSGYPSAGSTQSVVYDASELVPGVYFVRLQGETFEEAKRVVVVK